MKCSSPLWLWWRRHSFNTRRLRIKWIIFLCVCILLFIIIPNPFSSKYSKILLDSQDVQWNSISELLETKEKVNILLNKLKYILFYFRFLIMIYCQKKLKYFIMKNKKNKCERLNKLHKDDVTSYKNIGKFFNEKCF